MGVIRHCVVFFTQNSGIHNTHMTNRHCDIQTESAQRADSVKIIEEEKIPHTGDKESLNQCG